jgi:tetratricopeptide (TPR) repeat protein
MQEIPMRHLINTSSVVGLLAVFALSPVRAAEQNTVQKLVERGALQEAVDRAQSEGTPESTYLAAQALIKMENAGGAEERYSKLRDDGDESWKAIGEAGAKLLGGDTDGAMDAANRAVSANNDNPYAHYQLGLAAMRQNNYQRALEAFSRALELKPDLAYAHYYAGQAAGKVKQTAKMSEHFTKFLRLAPEAPEKGMVQSILRSLR